MLSVRDPMGSQILVVGEMLFMVKNFAEQSAE